MANKSYPAILLALLFCWGLTRTQDVPVPGAVQSLPVILSGGTIHTGTGNVLTGDLLFNNGKIVSVGSLLETFKNAITIDCKGKHIWPGLIAANTQIGLNEIESVRSLHDYAETGEINPNARAIIGYNTDSRVTPTIRSNGVLLAQVCPIGGIFSGTSSVVQLDAWNWEDAAYATDEGLHLNWPNMNLITAWWAPSVEEQEAQMKQELEKIRSATLDAKAYLELRKAGTLTWTDLRWESMIPVLEGKRTVFIHASSARQIQSAIAFITEFKLKGVIVGGQQSWMVTELLRESGVPVILTDVHRLPGSEDEDVLLPYKLPALLKAAGVRFCISVSGFWQVRNLAFHAGTAAAYGLTHDEALMSITKWPAEILGISDRTGTLEPGKDANLIITEGDVLNMAESRVLYAFIQGRKLDLGNRQKDLYKKFGTKYGMPVQ